ncbi:unnamed protein product [Caenorhabditis angaria]|uniref:Uncharacterized protein n=1 Tax=Caenorhabditis angaria TaxID=860376 RepID=A0A9P1I2Y0_9PELO|nr:unnamed protein product [Caenorhabditis angaria]
MELSMCSGQRMKELIKIHMVPRHYAEFTEKYFDKKLLKHKKIDLDIGLGLIFDMYDKKPEMMDFYGPFTKFMDALMIANRRPSFTKQEIAYWVKIYKIQPRLVTGKNGVEYVFLSEAQAYFTDTLSVDKGRKVTVEELGMAFPILPQGFHQVLSKQYFFDNSDKIGCVLPLRRDHIYVPGYMNVMPVTSPKGTYCNWGVDAFRKVVQFISLELNVFEFCPPEKYCQFHEIIQSLNSLFPPDLNTPVFIDEDLVKTACETLREKFKPILVEQPYDDLSFKSENIKLTPESILEHIKNARPFCKQFFSLEAAIEAAFFETEFEHGELGDDDEDGLSLSEKIFKLREEAIVFMMLFEFPQFAYFYHHHERCQLFPKCYCDFDIRGLLESTKHSKCDEDILEIDDVTLHFFDKLIEDSDSIKETYAETSQIYHNNNEQLEAEAERAARKNEKNRRKRERNALKKREAKNNENDDSACDLGSV